MSALVARVLGKFLNSRLIQEDNTISFEVELMKNLNLRQWVGKAGFAGISALGASFAAAPLSSATSLTNSFEQIYCTLSGVLPPIAMVLVIMAAVIYAAGQVGGAEFRANAAKWATALIVGAVLALVLILLLPGILGALDTTAGHSYAIACA